MYTRILRFAPSPNGHLHLGHAYSALLNFDMARALGGRLLLRIEDIDTQRCRPEFEAAIHEDLRWLGMAWDEPVRRQSEHFADYADAVAKLEARGVIYPSFESRSEIAALVAERDSQAAGRATPTACRSIRAAPAPCRRPSASAAAAPASRSRCASPWTPRSHRPAC